MLKRNFYDELYYWSLHFFLPFVFIREFIITSYKYVFLNNLKTFDCYSLLFLNSSFHLKLLDIMQIYLRNSSLFNIKTRVNLPIQTLKTSKKQLIDVIKIEIKKLLMDSFNVNFFHLWNISYFNDVCKLFCEYSEWNGRLSRVFLFDHDINIA